MQVSTTGESQEPLRGGQEGGYILSDGTTQSAVVSPQALPITITSIDPSVQHHQVYSIQPIPIQQQQPQLTVTPIKNPPSPGKKMGKKGNKKNVWVPGKPLTPKAREMMESGKGSMNQDGRWTCVECNRSLSNEWTLEQHVQTVHGERIFNCKNCNKKFKRRDHLLNHIKTIHKGLKPCKKCNVVFINKEELRAHKMAVHLKLAPEDTAPPPLARNTAQDVHQYLDEPSPPSTPAHRQAAAAAASTTIQSAPVQTLQRSANVLATYDNLVDGFSIPQHGGQQVVVTINPHPMPGQPVAYQQQPINVVPVAVSQVPSTVSQVQPTAYITNSVPMTGHTVHQVGAQHLQAQPVAVAPADMTPSLSGSPVKPTITYSSANNVLVTKPQLLPKKIVIPDTLICDIFGCEKKFKTASDYTAHRQLLHEEKRCSLCEQLFAGTRSLRAHMRSHEAGTLYKCSQCPGTFRLQATLQEHVDVFHVPNTCLECGSVLFGSEQTTDHIADQHPPNKILDQDDVQEGCNYQCSSCFYAFSKRFEAERHFVENHMTTDSDKIFHCCMYCKDVFLSYVRLDDHIQWEHGLEEIDENTVIDDAQEQVFYQCELCDHFFDEESALQKHIKKIHCGTRIPLKSKQLNMETPKKKEFIVKKRRIEEPAKIKCHYTECSDTFVQRTDLDAHIIMCHDSTTKREPVAIPQPVEDELMLESSRSHQQTGDELAKAVESILGEGPAGSEENGGSSIFIDDINKIAANAVITPVIDDGKYEALTVIEDSGIVEKIEETSAAVEAILPEDDPVNDDSISEDDDDESMENGTDIANGAVKVNGGGHYDDDVLKKQPALNGSSIKTNGLPLI